MSRTLTPFHPRRCTKPSQPHGRQTSSVLKLKPEMDASAHAPLRVFLLFVLFLFFQSGKRLCFILRSHPFVSVFFVDTAAATTEGEINREAISFSFVVSCHHFRCTTAAATGEKVPLSVSWRCPLLVDARREGLRVVCISA